MTLHVPRLRLPIAGLIIVCLCACLGWRAGAAAPGEDVPSAGPRVVVPFDADWRFSRGDFASAAMPAFDDSGWRRVELPHDWSAEGPFRAEYGSGNGYAPGGIGWYRKRFTLATELGGRLATVEFDGVYDHAEVWVNGHLVCGRPYGYSSFECALTPYLKFGSDSNVIAVRVDHSRFADSRWYTGSGIYRHVRLRLSAPLHIGHWGTFVTTPSVTSETARVRVETTIENRSPVARSFALESDVLRDGRVVATATTSSRLAAGSDGALVQQLAVVKPQRWSPESPALYTVRQRIRSDATVADEAETPFGIRAIRFDPDRGVFVNDVPLKLKGVCLHHDAGSLGAAVPVAAWERRLRTLKEIGVNAIRTSHNPPAPEFLDLCDKLGFLVKDEAFDEFTPTKNKWVNGWNEGVPSRFGYGEEFSRWSVTDVRDMVRRDRNHPSVIMWSIGNEVDYPNDPFSHPALGKSYRPENPPAGNLVVLARPLVDAVKAADPTRPVTMALASLTMSEAVGLPQLLDIVGYNYQESRYVDDHARYPRRVIFGSENSHQFGNWTIVRDHAFVAGQFLWTGIDYLGEARAFPNRANGAGLLDLAGFKKPAAWFRQSLWSDAPMVYLAASAPGSGGPRRVALLEHWNWPEGSTIRVSGYTNCDEVDLTLNGRSIGRRGAADAVDGVITWDVPYAAGEVRAVGLVKGQRAAEFSLKTAGAAARVDLRPLSSYEDVKEVEVQIVDAAGIRVPDSGLPVTFAVEGPARVLGIGNGNLDDTDQPGDLNRRVYQGRGLVILRVTGAAPAVTLRASAPGLQPAVLTVRAPSPDRPDAALPPAPAAAPASDEPPPYRDPARPVVDRVRDLVSRMTLEEKFWQLFMLPGSLDDPALDFSHGVFGLQVAPAKARRGSDNQPAGQSPEAVARAHAERINDIQRYFVEHTRLGIPIIPFDEALHGLVREGATAFPQGIALAATWDPSMVSRVIAAAARETRTRGIRQVLSPVVNIADDVRWGRVEETYGEDPYLASVMGLAFVEAFERAGVITTPKHFVANVGEGGRDSYPIYHNERLLAERYFPPFEAAVRQGHAGSVMTAYNSVDGAPATQNRWLLTDILKQRWGFEGFAISDASATGGATVLHMTEPDTPTAAADAWKAGLDVVFQMSYGEHRPYLRAFERGLVPPAVIDAAVSRVLRAKFELGLFEHPFVDADAAAAAAGRADHRTLALEAARASIVLLQNFRHRLPLTSALRSIAVIGTDAVEARLGGYSGPGIANVSILDGIREKVGSRADVRYAPGPGRRTREVVRVPADSLRSVSEGRPVPGLTGEYFDNIRLGGQPRLVRTDPQVDFGWTLSAPGPGIPLEWYSVRWTGSLRVPSGGVRRIGLQANDGYRLYLDGRLIIDNWKKQSYGTMLADVRLEPGSSHELRLEYFESTGNAHVRLVWDAGVVDDARAQIDSAVTLARRSEVAVVVAGIEEGEFRDRAFLGLPGRQETLIQEVAATGTPVVVILVGGSAVTMSGWIDRVDAVLDAWYPGEEGGHAVADVLFGDYNPAGRLPITFPLTEGQLPLSYDHRPTGRGDDYVDLTGQPRFPFGFGLSFTSFEYSALRIDPATLAPSGTTTVTCRVKNAGERAGDEVVQLYVRDLLASLARPVMELRGFRRVHLHPGEEADVAFELGPRDLRMLDRELRWVVEPGAFSVMVGSSSKDIRLRGRFEVR